MVAWGDRRVDQPGAKPGRGGVEKYRVIRVGERGVEIRGPAGDPVGFCQGFDFRLVSPDQDRVRHDLVAIVQRNPSLGLNYQDRAHQMLIGAHAPGAAIHDDAEANFRHVLLRRLSVRVETPTVKLACCWCHLQVWSASIVEAMNAQAGGAAAPATSAASVRRLRKTRNRLRV